jgi:small subunit ribosomal protein S20
MPHTASAKKRLRQSKQRNLRNRSVKHTIKTHVRKVLAAVAAKDAAAAMQEFSVASKKLDKAAARRILHPNAAARTKSRLATQVAGLAKTATSP